MWTSCVCGQIVCGQLCVSKLCGQVVCGGGGDGGRGSGRRAGGGGSAEPKTRTPHKDVGKNARPVHVVFALNLIECHDRAVGWIRIESSGLYKFTTP